MYNIEGFTRIEATLCSIVGNMFDYNTIVYYYITITIMLLKEVNFVAGSNRQIFTVNLQRHKHSQEVIIYPRSYQNDIIT